MGHGTWWHPRSDFLEKWYPHHQTGSVQPGMIPTGLALVVQSHLPDRVPPCHLAVVVGGEGPVVQGTEPPVVRVQSLEEALMVSYALDLLFWDGESEVDVEDMLREMKRASVVWRPGAAMVRRRAV